MFSRHSEQKRETCHLQDIQISKHSAINEYCNLTDKCSCKIRASISQEADALLHLQEVFVGVVCSKTTNGIVLIHKNCCMEALNLNNPCPKVQMLDGIDARRTHEVVHSSFNQLSAVVQVQCQVMLDIMQNTALHKPKRWVPFLF